MEKNVKFFRENWLLLKISKKKTQELKLKTKTQGFGKVENAICRICVQEKPGLKTNHIKGTICTTDTISMDNQILI